MRQPLLEKIQDRIDAVFGAGYAATHSDLVGSYLIYEGLIGLEATLLPLHKAASDQLSEDLLNECKVVGCERLSPDQLAAEQLVESITRPNTKEDCEFAVHQEGHSILDEV